MPGFNYSKWDNIELSDDEEDDHPNIDKDSWHRLKHRTRVEREEDEGKSETVTRQKLAKLKEDLKTYGEAGKEHSKAKKLQSEIDGIEEKLAKAERERKWNADNMCKTADEKTVVSESKAAPKPEPRLTGEDCARGYTEFVEEHEDLLETYIALGEEEDLEKVRNFLQEHGGVLLEGEHAESYLLLDCLEKEMNDMHAEMVSSARQNQLLTQLREYSRAMGRPVRDGVMPVFSRLIDHESTLDSFNESVQTFIKRVERRAVEKKKEMDAEAGEASDDEDDGPGPGGLSPMDVFATLPEEMQDAFRAKDMARLHAVIEALPVDEAKYHMKRCEESGLWVPNPEAGAPPYRAD